MRGDERESRRRQPSDIAAASDQRLLAAIARGEEGALLAAYDRYGAAILALSRRMTGAAAEADEVVHDVFLELWQSARRVRARRGKLRTFLVLRARALCSEMLAGAPELRVQAEAEGVGEQVWLARAPASRAPCAPAQRIVRRALDAQGPGPRAALARAFLTPGGAAEDQSPLGASEWERWEAALTRALGAVEER